MQCRLPRSVEIPQTKSVLRQVGYQREQNSSLLVGWLGHRRAAHGRLHIAEVGALGISAITSATMAVPHVAVSVIMGTLGTRSDAVYAADFTKTGFCSGTKRADRLVWDQLPRKGWRAMRGAVVRLVCPQELGRPALCLVALVLKIIAILLLIEGKLTLHAVSLGRVSRERVPA